MFPTFGATLDRRLLIFAFVSIMSESAVSEFIYGQHFPHGRAAVDYIYGVNGTFRQFVPLKYEWNYYEQFATPNHPFDKGALIGAADGSAFYTARDANGYLLCDSDHDLEVNPEYCVNGSAFHEHNGIAAKGIRTGNPFTQFWLDDNWLARYMSQAYLRPEPVGLVEQSGFLRWRVIGGDTTNWTPYNQLYFDTLALDGLYYLSRGDVPSAISQWDRSLLISSARWNDSQQTYEYPGVHENYHMGLWRVLTGMLLDRPEIPPSKNNQLFQHSVALRGHIVRNQEVDESGQRLGWISNIGSDTALINTESVSCCVLGLAANVKFVFEVMGQSEINTLSSENAIFIQDSEEKRKTKGPGFPLTAGKYTVEFILRAKNPSNTAFGSVKIIDTRTGQKFGERSLSAADFVYEGEWNRVSVNVNVDESNNLYDFQIEWTEKDVGFLEISAVVVK